MRSFWRAGCQFNVSVAQVSGPTATCRSKSSYIDILLFGHHDNYPRRPRLKLLDGYARPSLGVHSATPGLGSKPAICSAMRRAFTTLPASVM